MYVPFLNTFSSEEDSYYTNFISVIIKITQWKLGSSEKNCLEMTLVKMPGPKTSSLRITATMIIKISLNSKYSVN